MNMSPKKKLHRVVAAVLVAFALLSAETVSLAEQTRVRPPRPPRPAPAPAPAPDIVPPVPAVPPVPPVPAVVGDCDEKGDCPAHILIVKNRVYLGVHLLGLTDELRAFFGAPKSAGLLVSKIEPNGPADKGKIKVGDVLFEVDGKKINDVGALRRIVGKRKSGETATVKVIRSRKQMALKVKLEERERHQVDLGQVFQHGWPGEGFNIEIDERALEEATKQFEKKFEYLEHRKERLKEREKELEQRLKEMEERLRALEKKYKSEATQRSRAGRELANRALRVESRGDDTRL